LGFVDCTGEDDSGLTGEFVEEVDQINVLMLVGRRGRTGGVSRRSDTYL
jgi:hypothetical protein